jgi:NADH-quinone oxidoreductase subunit L
MHHALHAVHDHDTDAQDIRNMGGLRRKMPVTFWTFLVATLAISGVPLFSGFMSKDEILAGAWAFGGLRGGLGQLIPYIGFGVAALTAFYMFRLVYLTFYGEPARPDVHEHVHESPATMKVPIIVLSALSLWFIFAFNPIGPASGWFLQSVPTPVTVTGDHWYPFGGHHAAMTALEHAVHAAHTPAMITSLIVAGLGILIAFLTYRRRVFNADAVAARLRPVHVFLSRKWFFDEIYERWVVVPFVLLVTRMLNWFDAKVVDGAVNGSAWLTRVAAAKWAAGTFDTYVVDGIVNLTAYVTGFFGIVFRRMQTGRVQTYVALAVFGVIILFYAFF